MVSKPSVYILCHRETVKVNFKPCFSNKSEENANEEENKIKTNKKKTHWPISCDLALCCWKGVTSQCWECVCVCWGSGLGQCLETTQAPIIRGPSLETESQGNIHLCLTLPHIQPTTNRTCQLWTNHCFYSLQSDIFHAGIAKPLFM